MGTTESLPEDEAPPPKEPPESDPSSETAPDQPRHPTSPPSRPQQTDLHPTHPQRQSPQRPRPRPPPPGKPILRLEGLIVGGPKTGKRTLLQRLEGKDPFQELNGDKNEQKPATASIIIPYKPPLNSLSLDRIQLHIQCIHASDRVEEYFHQHQTQQTQTAFVVILVNPKHKLETTRSYVERLLTIHLDALGYSTTNGSSNESGLVHPVCLCFLLNFRDVARTDFPSTQALSENVDQIFQERGVPKQKIVMDWINVSLLNCYGLDRLHTFIYKAYLLRKEVMFEAQLLAVRNQMKATTASGQSPTSYQDFIAAVALQQEAKTPVQTEDGDDRRRQIHPSTKASKDHGKSQKDRQSTPKVEDRAPSKFPLQSSKRKSLEKKQHRMPARMGKDALEAFLASSSDEEDATPNRRKNKRSTGESSSSDDDDDDDFFYNEKGQRIYNHQAPPSHNVYQSDSSRDSKEPSGQQANAQQTPSSTKAPSVVAADEDEDSESHQSDTHDGQEPLHKNEEINSASQKRIQDAGLDNDSSYISNSNAKQLHDLNDDELDATPVVNRTKPTDDHPAAENVSEASEELSAQSSRDDHSIDDSARHTESIEKTIDDESEFEGDKFCQAAKNSTSDALSPEAAIDTAGCAPTTADEREENIAAVASNSKEVGDGHVVESPESESNEGGEQVQETAEAEESKLKTNQVLVQDDQETDPRDSKDEDDHGKNDASDKEAKVTTNTIFYDSDDDDDDYVISTTVSAEAPDQPSDASVKCELPAAESSEDDGDRQRVVSPPSISPQPKTDTASVAQKAPQSTGLSAAAMAAVLAAQQEAELMLQQQQQHASPHPDGSEKKLGKKSKKKKSGKEKKKKKKEKKRVDEDEDSD